MSAPRPPSDNGPPNEGPAPAPVTVAALMSTPLVTIAPEARLWQARATMSAYRTWSATGGGSSGSSPTATSPTA